MLVDPAQPKPMANGTVGDDGPAFDDCGDMGDAVLE
jgi:hypothetical protein